MRDAMAIAVLGLSVAAASAQTITGTPAAANTVTTITITNGACTAMPPPAEAAPPVTPSVAAGMAAARNRDYALARANFLPLAGQGDADAQRAMGQLLMQNCTGLQDKAAAVGWLARSADAGNAVAARLLGRAYMLGAGVAQDDARAFALYRKAADAGDAAGQAELGYFYNTGRGVAQDRYQGLQWSVKAAEQGNAVGLINVAAAYLKGEVLERDTDRAAYFLALANQRAAPGERANLMGTSLDIRRSCSVEDLERAAKRAMRWSPGPGSLKDVLSDAQDMRRHRS